MPPVYRPLVSFIATAMQTVLNLGLLCLGVILIVFLGKETLHLAHDARQMIDAMKFSKRARGDGQPGQG